MKTHMHTLPFTSAPLRETTNPLPIPITSQKSVDKLPKLKTNLYNRCPSPEPSFLQVSPDNSSEEHTYGKHPRTSLADRSIYQVKKEIPSPKNSLSSRASPVQEAYFSFEIPEPSEGLNFSFSDQMPIKKEKKEIQKKPFKIVLGNEIVEISPEMKAQSKFNNRHACFGPVTLSNTNRKTLELADHIIKNFDYTAINIENVIPLKELAVAMKLKKLHNKCELFIGEKLSFLRLSPKVIENSILYVKTLLPILEKLPTLSKETTMRINCIFQTKDIKYIDDTNIEELETAAQKLEIPKLVRLCEEYRKKRTNG